MKKHLTLVFTCLIATTAGFLAAATPGDLDLSFSSTGIAVVDFGDDDGQDIALQTDGKIVIAGTALVTLDDDWALVRLLTNGNIDTGFGTAGLVTTDVSGPGDYGRAVAVQTDGKIVVAGRTWDAASGSDFTVARYTTTGVLDSTFAADASGIVIADVDNNDNALGIAIQNDGKIVVVGSTWGEFTQDFAVLRFTDTGVLDSSFGDGGVVLTEIHSGSDIANAVAIQNDGKIVVVGQACMDAACAHMDFALARYETNGDLDPTFDSDGILTQAIKPWDEGAYAVALQDDDKIVAVGYTCLSEDCANSNFAVVRFLSNGAIDPGFVSSAFTDINGSGEKAYAVAISPNGSVVVTGTTVISGQENTAIVWFDGDGVPDAGFGANGVAINNIGAGTEFSRAIVIPNNGTVVIAGMSEEPAKRSTTGDFFALRCFGIDVYTDNFEGGDTSSWSSSVP